MKGRQEAEGNPKRRKGWACDRSCSPQGIAVERNRYSLAAGRDATQTSTDGCSIGEFYFTGVAGTHQASCRNKDPCSCGDGKHGFAHFGFNFDVIGDEGDFDGHFGERARGGWGERGDEGEGKSRGFFHFNWVGSGAVLNQHRFRLG